MASFLILWMINCGLERLSDLLKISQFVIVKWNESHSVMSNSLRPHGILQARIPEWVAFSFSR